MSEPISPAVQIGHHRITPLQFLLRRREPLQLLAETAAGPEDVIFVRAGRQHIVVLKHPRQIQKLLTTAASKTEKGRTNERALFFRFLGEGLLNAQGKSHRKKRRLILPVFHRMRLQTYAETMVTTVTQESAAWQDGDERDIGRDMMRIALSVMGRTLFSSQVDAVSEEIISGFGDLTKNLNRLLMPGAPLLQKLGVPAFRRIKTTQDRLDAVVRKLIVKRRQRLEASTDEDLLTLLMQAEDAEHPGERLSDDEIRDEVMTLLFTGQDPVGNTLTWIWWLLAQNPDQEQRLHEEIDRVLGDDTPAMAHVPRLVFVEQVVRETLRLYPAIWTMARTSLEELNLDGVTVPAGHLVIASQWLLHRDKRWFPDPLIFRPERWTTDAKAALPRFAYFPFGGGARNCIGENYALMEMVLVVATIAKRWRLERLSVDQPDIGIETRITLHPARPVRLRLRAR